MEAFIQNNITWLVPIVSIVLTILIKLSSKPESIALDRTDFLDFGFDLAASSIILILPNVKGTAGVWLLFIFVILIMVISIIVNRWGWNKNEKQPNWLGILLPDVLGVTLLIIATLYLGGSIK